MTPAAIARRLDAIELACARLAPPRPPESDQFTWLAWLSFDELSALEQLASGAFYAGREFSEGEERRVLATEAAALARMLSGEPRA